MPHLAFAALFSAALAAGPAPAPVNCIARRPHTLNVGVPRIASITRKDEEALTKAIRSVFATFPPTLDKDCKDRRPLQVNITVGNDYQILDWLTQGVIDAGVVPDLSLTLLVRDTVPLYEIWPVPGQPGTLLAPAYVAPEARRLDLKNRTWEVLPDPLDEYETFLDQIWNETMRPGLPPPAKPHVLLLGSHLSSTGFAWPVGYAAHSFDRRAKPGETVDEEKLWKHFFAATRFALDCSNLDGCFREALAGEHVEGEHGDEHVLPADTTVILFPGEETFPTNAAPPISETKFRPHLVIRTTKANAVFDIANAPGHFTLAAESIAMRPDGTQAVSDFAHLPAELRRMIPRRGEVSSETPSVFQSIFVTEPFFGVRTYAFTVDESLRLVRQQQRSTASESLALVLPGGGVKAAYQTRIIDELYKHHLLRNINVPASGANKDALPVKTVIGTSGGALIGYFVAQLSEHPTELFDILWKNTCGLYMQSTDIFGWTDLLRYVSIVVSFGIFCVLLFFASPVKAPAPRKHVYRWRLTIAIVPLFIAAPLFIKLMSITGEHVPEIEGIFYALIAIMVMAMDQSLVYTPRETPQAAVTPSSEPQPELTEWQQIAASFRRWWKRLAARLAAARHWFTFRRPELTPEEKRRVATLRSFDVVLLAAGGFLLLFSAIWPRRNLTFRVAFPTLCLLVIGGTLVLVIQNHGKLAKPLRRSVEIAAAIALVLFICAHGWVPKEAHIFAGFGLILTGAFEYWYISRIRRRVDVQWAVTIVAVYLIAALCWPENAENLSFRELLRAESMKITAGSFFLSLGFIMLLVAGTIWTYRREEYTFDQPKELRTAMVVVIAYALITLLILAVLTALIPDIVTPLELTARFWFTLGAISLVIGLGMIIAARSRRFRDKEFGKGIAFLCEDHPNGTIVQKRYARMLLLAIFAVGWWNVVAAPALYGNRHALNYHKSAIDRFNEVQFGNKNAAFRPTARFVTPTNLLQRDGTRYFMFIPSAEVDCPPVEDRPASGARWTLFRAEKARDERCKVDQLEDDEFVKHVAFASGSPFPIFPAHALPKELERRLSGENAYVDGGYSNNIPVDAARTLEAKQVLIIQSSNPLPPPETDETKLEWLAKHAFGNLIRNSERLPGYLFERSQQIDRQSSRDMFVISLSPRRDEPNWPPLTDFRASIVRRMQETATRDLGERIGMVISWGQPAFSLNAEVIGPPAR